MSPAIDVSILCGDPARGSSTNVAKIAQFLGVSSTVVSVSDGSASWRSAGCLVAEADALIAIAGTDECRFLRLRELLAAVPHVFVHGFEPSRPHGELLRELSSNSYAGVQPLPEAGGGL